MYPVVRNGRPVAALFSTRSAGLLLLPQGFSADWPGCRCPRACRWVEMFFGSHLFADVNDRRAVRQHQGGKLMTQIVQATILSDH